MEDHYSSKSVKLLQKLLEQVRKQPEFRFTQAILEGKPNVRLALVGGIVRDALLGHESKDYDFIVEGISIDDLIECLKPFGFVDFIQSRTYGVVKFMPAGTKFLIDIALPRTESYEPGKRIKHAEVKTKNITIEEDFSRRDFTINAMGLDLKTGQLIDPFDGLTDIRNKTIRAVGNPQERFLEDPTRILRGIRFAVQFNFDIEDKTWQEIVNLKEEMIKTYLNEQGQALSRVAPEKIGEEILRTIKANPDRFFNLYDRSNLISMLFPEVYANKGIKQPVNFHTEGDVYDHIRLAMQKISREASLEAKLATFFHDIGKAKTFLPPEETGDRIRFNDHEKVGALEAKAILKRLRISNQVIEEVVWLVQNHLIMMQLPKMRPSKQKALVKNPWFSDLVEVVKADTLSTVPVTDKPDLSFLKIIDKISLEIKKDIAQKKKPQIINGYDIITLFDQKKFPISASTRGKLIGKIKEEVNYTYLDGEISTKKEALNLAQKLIEIETNKSDQV